MASIAAATEQFRGRKVTVVGLAREGLALTRFLASHGALVTVSDAKTALDLAPAMKQLDGLDVRFSLGGNRVEEILGAEIVFVSPGVPPTLPSLEAARRAGIPMSSSTRLFFQFCQGRIAGVTGSCGKSTVTTLLGEMLIAAGKKTLVGGNLGTPLIERLPEIDKDTWAVLEMSSFQLESMEESPQIAIMTNLRPDHLDRHASLDEYASAKAHIFRYQGQDDFLLLNYDDAAVRGFASEASSRVLYFSLMAEMASGAYLLEGNLVIRMDGMRERIICPASEVRLPGRHNLYNVLAASLAASLCGVELRVAGQIARSFQGLPHRIELVKQIKGVSYYNDSIATTPDRALAAISSFHRPIILISGGRDKHLPLEPLAGAIRERCKAVVLYGEGGALLQDVLAEHKAQQESGLKIRRVHAFDEAVEVAASLAKAGDVVLMSPGFTSFDQFSSYEERGHRFRSLVEGLR